MNPATVHRRLLTPCPESLATLAKGYWATALLAVLALALWLAALGFTSVTVHSKASPSLVPASSALATQWDTTPYIGTSTLSDPLVAEPAETRLADLPAADMEGSDAERFPARSNVPLGHRGYNWLKSAALLADYGRVNELLRPPDA